MKLSYIPLLLLVIVGPLSGLNAQDEIVSPSIQAVEGLSDSNSTKRGDVVQLSQNFPEYCHCLYASDYSDFTIIYNALAAREREALLRHQQGLLKDRIEDVMNKDFNSFEDARNFVFKRFSLPTTNQIYKDIRKDYSNQLNRNSQQTRIAKKYESRLYEIRKREFLLGISQSSLGDLAINDKIIVDMPSSTINSNLISTNNFITNSENKYKEAYRVVRGIDKVESEEILENAFMSTMIAHFNQYNFQDQVFLMTKYMIYLNTNSVVQSTAPYGPPTFNPTPYLQNYENTGVFAAMLRGDEPSISYPPVTDAIAKIQHALNTDLKDAKSWINASSDNWNTLNTYLQSNNFGNGTLETAGKLFTNYYKDRHTEFLGHLTWKSDGPPRYAWSRDVDRVYSIKPNIYGYSAGFKGIGNLLNQLYFAESTRNFKLSGALIRDLFVKNGISVPYNINNEDIGRLFRFEPGINDYGNQSTTAYRTEITYRTSGFAARIFWGGISLSEVFASYGSFQAILKIESAFKNGLIDGAMTTRIFKFLGSNQFSAQSILFMEEALRVIPTGSKVDFFERIIEDPSFENSKANCVFENLKVRSEGYRKLLRKFLIDGDSAADLKFEVKSIPAPNPLAIRNAVTSPPENGIITITINKDNLADRTELGLIRTIVHESLHAEIYRQLFTLFNNNGSISGITHQRFEQILQENKFPDLFDAIRQYGFDRFQHDFIAENYLGVIFDTLKAYDKGQNDDQLYKDLAWVGLTDTKVYRDLPDSEEERIENVQEQYSMTGNKDCSPE